MLIGPMEVKTHRENAVSLQDYLEAGGDPIGREEHVQHGERNDLMRVRVITEGIKHHFSAPLNSSVSN